jgi:peptide deformylase
MTMRPIRLLGDAVLRTPCDPVTSFDAELRELVTDLMDTLLGAPGRAGVAANQIGVSARVFVYLAGGQRGHLVNPTLELSEETEEGDEGCLSLPGLSFPTPRAKHAVARGFDQYGEPVTISGSGFLARALQHETDHLDGRLYVDRLTGDTRRQALRAVRAASWAAPTR